MHPSCKVAGHDLLSMFRNVNYQSRFYSRCRYSVIRIADLKKEKLYDVLKATMSMFAKYQHCDSKLGNPDFYLPV